ncbi:MULTISPECIES: hypothetical protein [unclassified Streptomyces]|uniref:hypothetical protein n=1 Tax=unclassified Streptomyces TaxID=2593676 RepID=UPI0006AFB9C2|nr:MULTISPECIES: hypothetical protein [unclassified Streptomyces]KOU85059.1 hypothetical protein ADK93_23610 [Streptomyces sp. XY58]KOV05300.1 hypothetical protein ADK89_19890 [Streptomyces sp. XY37]KOV49544.1 hypothetical protein ADK99_12260 [Streptomyces sp. MMG1064]
MPAAPNVPPACAAERKPATASGERPSRTDRGSRRVRYVILGAIDAQAVCRAVHPDYHADRYPHIQGYRDHVASGRPIRIIRIRLAPGEGCVAPTEYLLHDGSTEAQDRPSAAALWLGHWPRGILPSLI